MSNRKPEETNFIQITFKEHKILLCLDHVNDFDKWCTVIRNIQAYKANPGRFATQNSLMSNQSNVRPNPNASMMNGQNSTIERSMPISYSQLDKSRFVQITNLKKSKSNVERSRLIPNALQEPQLT